MALILEIWAKNCFALTNKENKKCDIEQDEDVDDVIPADNSLVLELI